MEFRAVPGTDLALSAVGLGCYGLGGAYGPADPEGFELVVQKARELGVTYFDTADQYGDAEEILGRALRPFRREVAISTKVGLTADNGRDLSYAHVLAACDRSLKRLATDYIDIYQVHFDDPRTPVAETVGALKDLRKSGKIRFYGVGHLPAERVEEYLGHAEGSAEPGDGVKTVMLELSPVARGAYTRTAALRDRLIDKGRDFGIIGFSTTGRGVLTGKIREGHRFAVGDIRGMDPLFQGARFRSALRVADKLQGVGSRLGKTAAQVAIAWVLSLPGVVTALVGPSRTDHMEENVGGAGWTLPEEELGSLNAFLEEEDRWLSTEKRREVASILERELSTDAGKAFKDLIYVMEELGEEGLVREADLLPLFQALLTSRKSGAKEGPDISALRAVHAQLRRFKEALV